MSSWLFRAVALCALVGLAACGPEPPGLEAFSKAEETMLNGGYDQAAQEFKRFLVWNPEHAGGHYYLARCYYAKENFWLTIARGEVATALSLFIEQGRQSPIERYSNEYFEFICHIDIARISRVQAMVVMANQLPPQAADDFIGEAKDALDRARSILPDSADIELVENEIAEADLALEQYRKARSVQPRKGTTAPERPNRRPRTRPGSRRSRFTSAPRA